MTGLTIRAATAAATTAGTPPVTQNIDASGGTLPNENPVAAIYLMTSCTTLGTAAAPLRFGMGMTDGTTQRALGALSDSPLATGLNDNQTRTDNATVIQFTIAGNGNLDSEASWSAWRTNGSQISWADLPASAFQVGAIYLFGTDVRASVQQVSTSASIGGTASITGLPFAPNCCIVMSTDTAFPADTDNPHLRIGIGFGCTNSGTIQQAYSYMSGFDRSPTQTSGAQSVGSDGVMKRLIATSGGGAPTVGARQVIDSFNPDGITFRTEDVAESTTLIVMCLYVPHKVWVGIPALDLTVADTETVTTGWPTQAYFAIGTAMTTDPSTSGGATVVGKLSFGVRTADEELCASAQLEDAVGTSDTRSLMVADVARILDDAGATLYAISHSSFDSTGITVNVDTAAASNRLVPMMIFGSGRNDGQWLPNFTGHRRWRRQLARM